MSDAIYDLRSKRVFVAGASGMVGSALVRRLAREDCEVLTVPHERLDLRRQADTEAWLAAHRPHVVLIAAARVGGILANTSRPGEFIHDNLAIAQNLIHGSWAAGVERLAFLGSACMFPRMAEQPIREDSLLTGPLEPTNEAYAVAKFAGLALCQAYRRQYGAHFIVPIPTNLYGPGDNFDPAASHVVPATIRKVEAARQNNTPVVIWGTGTPTRELLHVDDAADAIIFLLRHYDGVEPINIGCGQDISIRALTEQVAAVMEFAGEFELDLSKPDGMPRKQLDSTRLLDMGWRAQISLADGLAQTIAWYRDTVTNGKLRIE